MSSSPAAVKSLFADLLLWTLFVAGLAASGGAGSVLDGTRQDVATCAGGVVALIAGSRIARKPGIKAFLSLPGTLWFLFLFNGGMAVTLYFVLGGTDGVIAASAMGAVSLGAAGGLVAARRKGAAGTTRRAPARTAPRA
ncbi:MULTISPECIES: hypothetical protein [Streptomyces]|uniref:Uncharacterized protein n=1 Tax=Streptomyces pseudovenezuelae TaxID=67350 RepID=A0A101NDF4_9ACTN|nr:MULTISPECIES: hypothetical protein [Streptomyces]KUM90989.1 hypothetical protein AQI94_04190 [Streptomyces pseudovenezuelae]